MSPELVGGAGDAGLGVVGGVGVGGAHAVVDVGSGNAGGGERGSTVAAVREKLWKCALSQKRVRKMGPGRRR